MHVANGIFTADAEGLFLMASSILLPLVRVFNPLCPDAALNLHICMKDSHIYCLKDAKWEYFLEGPHLHILIFNLCSVAM